MLVAARAGAWSGEVPPTSIDYARDSSVFLFDGIDNVGIGAHGDSSTWASVAGSASITAKLNGSYWDDTGLSGNTISNTSWASAVFCRLDSIYSFFIDSDCSILVTFRTNEASNILELPSQSARIRVRVKSGGDKSGIVAIRSLKSDVNTGFFCFPENSSSTESAPNASVNGYFGGGLYVNSYGVIGMNGTIYAIRGYREFLDDDTVRKYYEWDKARFNLP